MTGILSIQSEVAYGHVGQGAARLALQRLGIEVAAVPTVLLAHHPAYPEGFVGRILPPEELRSLIAGVLLRAEGLGLGAALTGYLRTPEQLLAVADGLEAARALRPGLTLTVDPVLGDAGRLYVDARLAEAIRTRLFPLADLATPNLFELEVLCGRPLENLRAVIAGARSLGLPRVVVTSVPLGAERLATLLVEADAVRLVETPLLPVDLPGTGDLFAALVAGRRALGTETGIAVSLAVSSVYAVIERSIRMQRTELALVAAQDALADPPRIFPVTPA
ncbi:MAG: pyridoxal kinase [Alphaproteobacteria bacterium]|nr:pyridoxal kinase [Alphaproteobacteria bacterium]